MISEIRVQKLWLSQQLFFIAAALLGVGATCTPNVQVRGAPASLGDVEVNDMNLRVINHDVHLSFVAKITAHTEDWGALTSVKLHAAKLEGRYVHDDRTRKLGTIRWESTDLQPGSEKTFTSLMNASFTRESFWGAWMTTDYHKNEVALEFGPIDAKFDLIPDNFLMSWLLESSDLSTSYSYDCNYTIFVQALFYNSISCAAPPLTDTNTARLRVSI
mmetsp:Transcript_20772/g.68623  ORF Transcript_20772/g.68623 Transcript_20772/m.68623 type:complete len:217 (+) Transcript_20772:1101-1751(+)